jgi:hypothetical protein
MQDGGSGFPMWGLSCFLGGLPAISCFPLDVRHLN